MRGEGETGSAEAGEDFIQKHFGPNLACGLRRSRGVTVRMHHHASSTLDTWLKHPGSQLISSLVNCLLRLSGTLEVTLASQAGICVFGLRLIVRAAVAGGSHHLLGWKENGLEVPMEGWAMAEAHRADSVPVIRAFR